MLDYVFSKSIRYRFLDFRSGEDCLRSLHLNPEIVVLDHQLNGMNGFETLQEIKEQNPNIHVIMLLGENDGRLPVDFLNAGADDYVLKAAGIEKLIEKIEDRLTQGFLINQSLSTKMPSLKKKLYYALILLLLASAGVYYYQ